MADTPSTPSGAAEDDIFSFESVAEKTYPMAPEGQHKVVVSRATYKLRDNTFSPEKGKQHTVNLMLQSDQKYKDDKGGEVPYNLFVTLKVSDHADSLMLDFFKSVLGIPVPLREVGEEGAKRKQIFFERKIEKVEDGEDRIHFPQFENLEFMVVVKHKKGKNDDKIRDRVDSWFATPEQKASNLALFHAPQA